jgi:YggT family protein
VASVAYIITGLLQLINGLLLLWCLLSWFPNIRWYEQPFKTLDNLVRPIVAPFRRIIPPISNIDLSPMVAMIVLTLVTNIVQQLL